MATYDGFYYHILSLGFRVSQDIEFGNFYVHYKSDYVAYSSEWQMWRYFSVTNFPSYYNL